jgi:hypothetical protein
MIFDPQGALLLRKYFLRRSVPIPVKPLHVGHSNPANLQKILLKLLWFGHAKILDRNTSRRALELKFKGQRPMERTRTRWFSQVLEDIKKMVKSR